MQLLLGRTTESIFPFQDALVAGLPSINQWTMEIKR